MKAKILIVGHSIVVNILKFIHSNEEKLARLSANNSEYFEANPRNEESRGEIDTEFFFRNLIKSNRNQSVNGKYNLI